MSKITRRELLHGAMLTAAAMTLPSCARQRATTQPTAAAGGNVIGANERIRVAVFGVHGRGGGHVSAYAGMKNVEVAAIADVDWSVIGGAMKSVEKKTGKSPAFYQDFRRILDDKSIDAVSIATPNHWHSLQAIWAVQAGKDVYVEKPVSQNVWEGRQLVEAARKYGRIVQAGTQSRSSGAIREAMEYIWAGKLGKLTIARGLCYKRRKSIGHFDDEPIAPVGVDYNLWLGPANVRPFNKNRFHYEWHWNWDYGNGDIGNQGVHQMDICRWGLRKNELPRSVGSLGGRFGYIDDGQTPNTQISWMDWGDVQLIFEVRGLPTPKYMGADIGNIFHCTDGYVVVGGGVTAFSPTGERICQFKAKGVDHFANFISAMRSRKPGDLNAEITEGHLSSALGHVGNISYRLGQAESFGKEPEANADMVESFRRFRDHLRENQVEVDKLPYQMGRKLLVDAKTESFINDGTANALLTRAYRQPFVVPQVV